MPRLRDHEETKRVRSHVVSTNAKRVSGSPRSETRETARVTLSLGQKSRHPVRTTRIEWPVPERFSKCLAITSDAGGLSEESAALLRPQSWQTSVLATIVFMSLIIASSKVVGWGTYSTFSTDASFSSFKVAWVKSTRNVALTAPGWPSGSVIVVLKT